MNEPPDAERPPLPSEPSAPEPLPGAPPPSPPRFPFWGYGDLFVFVGFAFVCLLAGLATVKLFLILSHLQVRNELFKMLPAQFLGYLYLFLGVKVMFRVQYDRPFWSSMAWAPPHMTTGALIGCGVLTALAVAAASSLLHTPDVPTPMSKLLADRSSVILVAIFGVSLGPLCEELIFRGFLQPLFVRTLGAAAGIVLAAVPFGLLHLDEYGYSWRHGLLITLAGAAFGWIRYRTGSTKASTIMHAAYNGTFFLALAAKWKDLPHALRLLNPDF